MLPGQSGRVASGGDCRRRLPRRKLGKGRTCSSWLLRLLLGGDLTWWVWRTEASTGSCWNLYLCGRLFSVTITSFSCAGHWAGFWGCTNVESRDSALEELKSNHTGDGPALLLCWIKWTGFSIAKKIKVRWLQEITEDREMTAQGTSSLEVLHCRER